MRQINKPIVFHGVEAAFFWKAQNSFQNLNASHGFYLRYIFSVIVKIPLMIYIFSMHFIKTVFHTTFNNS